MLRVHLTRRKLQVLRKLRKLQVLLPVYLLLHTLSRKLQIPCPLCSIRINSQVPWSCSPFGFHLTWDLPLLVPVTFSIINATVLFQK